MMNEEIDLIPEHSGLKFSKSVFPFFTIKINVLLFY